MDEKETIQDIRERLVRIETLLEESSKTNILQANGLEEKIKVCNRRIEDLESNQKWFVCSIIAGFITMIYTLFK